MSQIIKLTYDAADARARYARIHEAVFKLSLRGMVAALKQRKWIDYEARQAELSKISRTLEEIEKALSRIDDAEMSRVRGGGLIRLALLEYVQALGCSVRMLRGICRSEMDRLKGQGDQRALVEAKAAYDDAVQYHRRLGDRLNQLLASF